jgi:hypothetical protein
MNTAGVLLFVPLLVSSAVAAVQKTAAPPRIEVAYTQFKPTSLHVILEEDHSIPQNACVAPCCISQLNDRQTGNALEMAQYSERPHDHPSSALTGRARLRRMARRALRPVRRGYVTQF